MARVQLCLLLVLAVGTAVQSKYLYRRQVSAVDDEEVEALGNKVGEAHMDLLADDDTFAEDGTAQVTEAIEKVKVELEKIGVLESARKCLHQMNERHGRRDWGHHWNQYFQYHNGKIAQVPLSFAEFDYCSFDEDKTLNAMGQVDVSLLDALTARSKTPEAIEYNAEFAKNARTCMAMPASQMSTIRYVDDSNVLLDADFSATRAKLEAVTNLDFCVGNMDTKTSEITDEHMMPLLFLVYKNL